MCVHVCACMYTCMCVHVCACVCMFVSVSIPAHSLQEVQCDVVVADIASLEGEAPIAVPHLCDLDADLTVLHHLVHAIARADHTHLLCGLDLLHHLCSDGISTVASARAVASASASAVGVLALISTAHQICHY